MKSPFPGMDPFIEACGLWEDFHDALIQGIKRGLNLLLPDRYLARTGERGYVVLADAERESEHTFRPDVTVTSRGIESPGDMGGIAVIEPASEPEAMAMRAFIEDRFRETFVEIREADSDKLVTTIEVLSPSNKKPNSEGWNVYLRKRQGLLMGRAANLIEIDLLRGGQRMPMRDPWPNSPFTLLVGRVGRSSNCLVWPAHCVRRLPAIPVPLLPPDPDITLDLQPILDRIYEESRYYRSIDYTRSLTPPLTASEGTFLQAPSS